MKSTLALLCASVLAAQGSNLRINGPIYNPDEPALLPHQPHPHFTIPINGPIYNPVGPTLPHLLDNKLFNIGHVFNHVVDQVDHTAQQVGNDVSHTAQNVGNQVADTAQDVGNQVSNTAQNVGNQVSNTAQDVGNQVSNTAQNVGNQVSDTAQRVGRIASNEAQRLGEQAQKVLDQAVQVAEAAAASFPDIAGFANVVNLWEQVDWNTGAGLIEAIQATAQADVTFFQDLNALTGGLLTPTNLQAAEEISSFIFPPAAIVIEAGVITMDTGSEILDITEMVQKIQSDIQGGNIPGAVVEGFKLFMLISGY